MRLRCCWDKVSIDDSLDVWQWHWHGHGMQDADEARGSLGACLLSAA